MAESAEESNAALVRPTFAEAFRFWLKLGFISFGGPAGQIAIMHTELVERKRWISESRFLHALNYCMLLPGPEAQQLATYSGWLLHGTRGGLVAGTLFVLPAALLLWGLGLGYMLYGDVNWVRGMFDGLKPAVLAIVVAAVLRIGTRALKNPVMWTLAALAFVAFFFFNAPFPVIVLGAGSIGLVGGRWWRDHFLVIRGHAEADATNETPTGAAGWGRTLRTLIVGLLCWWVPVGLAAWLLGGGHTVVREGIFFSKAAMVTFGGAYAVLPYVAQQAVEQQAWLASGQMLDGLGLAETTPGPLIMVVQFVGFVGAWQNPGTMTPWVAATVGAAMTTWVTFAPCFLWIFLGAPHIERLRRVESLSCALSAITAAVVGVILNLAVWFGMQVLFPAGRVDVFGIVIAIVAFLGMHFGRWNLLWVVAGAALAGVCRHLVL